MNPERKKTLIIIAASVAGTLSLFALGGLAFIYSGIYNVAATDEHTGLVRWALTSTTTRSIEARAGADPALPEGDEALRRGFLAYEAMCVDCHGAPGVERGWIGSGLQPTGPDLAAVAARRTPAQLLWAIEHGIKFTGMPALSPTHSQEEMLEVTAFVVRLKDMTASDYAELRRSAEAASPAAVDDQDEPGHVTVPPEGSATGAEVPAAPKDGHGHDHVH